jgi:molybdate transport system substrate-binding protein
MSVTLRVFLASVALLFAAACSPAAAPPPTVAPAPPPTVAPAAAAPSSAPAAASPATVASPSAAAAAAAKPAVSPAPIAAASAVASPSAAAAAAKPSASPSAAPAAGAAAPAKPSAAGPISGEIVVFAASSLTDVFQDMVADFGTANPEAKLTFNFGASSQLATQLGQGASADDFASADTVQMDAARKAGAITGDNLIFARNRLVLITPKDNPEQITSVKDLAKDGVKFVTAAPSVPIGTYTMQMLDKAVADPSYGADFKDKVIANTVSQEDNVRQVVSKVQLGEADAAVVYSTDPTPQVRDQLQLIQIPDALQTLATYPIAVAKGNNAAGGAAFAAYVVGLAGQAILAKWGFLPPTETSAAAQPTPAPTGGQPPAAGGAAASAAAASAPVPGVASSTFSPDVAIKGLVGSPRSFSMEDLVKLPAETVQVSYQAARAPPAAASPARGCSTCSMPRAEPSCRTTATTPSCG